jgi:hypothetical protein
LNEDIVSEIGMATNGDLSESVAPFHGRIARMASPAETDSATSPEGLIEQYDMTRFDFEFMNYRGLLYTMPRLFIEIIRRSLHKYLI